MLTDPAAGGQAAQPRGPRRGCASKMRSLALSLNPVFPTRGTAHRLSYSAILPCCRLQGAGGEAGSPEKDGARGSPSGKLRGAAQRALKGPASS